GRRRCAPAGAAAPRSARCAGRSSVPDPEAPRRPDSASPPGSVQAPPDASVPGAAPGAPADCPVLPAPGPADLRPRHRRPADGPRGPVAAASGAPVRTAAGPARRRAAPARRARWSAAAAGPGPTAARPAPAASAAPWRGTSAGSSGDSSAPRRAETVVAWQLRHRAGNSLRLPRITKTANELREGGTTLSAPPAWLHDGDQGDKNSRPRRLFPPEKTKGRPGFPGRPFCTAVLSLRQALAHHFIHIRRQLAAGQDTLQLATHQRLAGRGIPAPAGQRGQLAGGDLRVEAVQGDHLVGQEAVAAAIQGVEVHVVLVGEGANQRAHLVGVLDVERGV